MKKKTKRTWFLAVALFIGLAAAAVAWWAAGSTLSPRFTTDTMEDLESQTPADSRPTDGPLASSAEKNDSKQGANTETRPSHKPTGKHAEFYADADMDARLGYLQRLAAERTEEWDSDFLWRMIVLPEGGELAKAAMETSILIAEGNADDSLERAVPKALKVPSAEVRRAALRFVAKHNCPGNAAALLEHYERYPEDRAIALATIAGVAHADAQIHILNVASNDETPRDLRIRAIALLAKAQSGAAVDLLESLSKSQDEQISQAAVQALKSYRR